MKITKRKLMTAMLAAFSLCTTILPALAQSGTRVPEANRLDFLAGYLSLTDTQKTQATTIFTAAATATATAQGQRTAAQAALTAAIKINASDSELDRLSAALGVIHGQITAIQAKASAKFYALLTADQKTKFDALGDRQGGLGGNGSR
jgi:Spy/CpxP family protein refolding chaperone